VLLAVPLHCAIGLGMGLVSFGTVMVAMNLSGLFPTRAAAVGASTPTESSTCYPDDIPVAA
jgi:hypothetical protein